VKKLSLVLLALIACSPRYIPYHSTASIPLLSNLTISDLKYICDPAGKYVDKAYGLFSAVDNSNTYYLLIAPRLMGGSSGGGDPFKKYDIAYGVPISSNKIGEFLGAIRSAIQDYDSLRTKEQAKFIELMIAPEQEVKPVSDNVYEWKPSLRFTYQNTDSGSHARLLFGRGLFLQMIEMKDKQDLLDLESIVVMGKENLRIRGCAQF
jgi:hypothetical protein